MGCFARTISQPHTLYTVLCTRFSSISHAHVTRNLVEFKKVSVSALIRVRRRCGLAWLVRRMSVSRSQRPVHASLTTESRGPISSAEGANGAFLSHPSTPTIMLTATMWTIHSCPCCSAYTARPSMLRPSAMCPPPCQSTLGLLCHPLALKLHRTMCRVLNQDVREHTLSWRHVTLSRCKVQTRCPPTHLSTSTSVSTSLCPSRQPQPLRRCKSCSELECDSCRRALAAA